MSYLDKVVHNNVEENRLFYRYELNYYLLHGLILKFDFKFDIKFEPCSLVCN